MGWVALHKTAFILLLFSGARVWSDPLIAPASATCEEAYGYLEGDEGGIADEDSKRPRSGDHLDGIFFLDRLPAAPK